MVLQLIKFLRNSVNDKNKIIGGFYMYAHVNGVNKTFLENTGPWRRKLREYEYGTLGADDDFFEEIAPLNHLERIEAPLLVFHGKNDTRVPVSEAEQLTAIMRELKKDVELVVFEDEGHQTDKHSNHITKNTLIVEFFNKTL